MSCDANCVTSCTCESWRDTCSAIILGVVGILALCVCIAVLVLDMHGYRSSRTACQTKCLRWSNLCNLMSSLYYVAYALVNSGGTAFREWDCLTLSLFKDFGSLFFLNCCVFKVFWPEFFGYGSLFWNIMWLLDLARYTAHPLARDKLQCGLPLMLCYHFLTWFAASWIAFGST